MLYNYELIGREDDALSFRKLHTADPVDLRDTLTILRTSRAAFCKWTTKFTFCNLQTWLTMIYHSSLQNRTANTDRHSLCTVIAVVLSARYTAVFLPRFIKAVWGSVVFREYICQSSAQLRSLMLSASKHPPLSLPRIFPLRPYQTRII